MNEDGLNAADQLLRDFLYQRLRERSITNPPHLWHYTNNAVRILESKHFRAGNIFHQQRDPKEFIYGVNEVVRLSQSHTGLLPVAAKFCKLWRSNFIAAGPYLACFTDTSDSQKHIEDFGRFAIRFELLKPDLEIFKTCYDSEEMSELIRAELQMTQEALNIAAKAAGNEASLVQNGARWAAGNLMALCCQFKESRLNNEREHRYIHFENSPIEKKYVEIKFRSGDADPEDRVSRLVLKEIVHWSTQDDVDIRKICKKRTIPYVRR